MNQSFINRTNNFYFKWVIFVCLIFHMNYLRPLWIIRLCLPQEDRLQFWKGAVDFSFCSRKMTGLDFRTALYSLCIQFLDKENNGEKSR